MKTLLVVFDAEGLPGIKTWKDVCANFETDEPTKKLIKTAKITIEKTIKGAEEAGYKNIIILDWHASAQNIPRKEIKSLNNTQVEILEGIGPNFKYALKKADCAILVGMHGKYGSADGNPPMHKKEFNKNGPQGIAHVWAFSIKHLLINNKSVGESIFIHNIFAEHSVPILFSLGTLSAIRELKKYDSRIITLSNLCSYDAIRKKVASSLKQNKLTIKKPYFNKMAIELKKSKDSEIDKTRILAHRDAFASMRSKKIQISDRRIEFNPTSKTPFLEVFYLMSLRKFR